MKTENMRIVFMGTPGFAVGVLNALVSNSYNVVKIDEKYFRPCEVDFLLGDATKAETELGWTREYDLDGLIDDMMK